MQLLDAHFLPRVRATARFMDHSCGENPHNLATTASSDQDGVVIGTRRSPVRTQISRLRLTLIRENVGIGTRNYCEDAQAIEPG
jgi:hypothetical protein